MRNFLLAFLVVFVSTSFVVPEVQAKRFGGGGSIGKSFFSKKSAAPAAKPGAANAAKSGTAKKAGMAGLMGGLLAGGILGALFFGGAFEGIQIMDILLLVAGAFIIFKIIGMMKKSSQTYATPQGQVRMNPQEETFNSNGGTGASDEAVNVPAWFNAEQFVKGAKSHFSNLQQAWDDKNWDEIATYTTDDVLAALKSERAALSDDLNTQVVSVNAQLVGFKEEQGFVVAGINFCGKIKEDSALVAKDFDETWHLTRDMSVENADWVIAGIEQNV